MTWRNGLGIACVAFSAVTMLTGSVAGAQSLASLQADAVKASPDLVQALSSELGSTPEQAAGAAGALFGIAKTQLKADEFSQVAKAVPGMSSLLKAAPKANGSSSSLAKASGAMAQAVGTAGALGPAASAFSSLGLKPELVTKAVPILTQFVSKGGGADVAKLLASALK